MPGAAGGYGVGNWTATMGFAGSGGGTTLCPTNPGALLGVASSATFAGVAGIANTGQGGTGAAAGGGTVAAQAGGAGGSGIVIVTEFI